MHLEEQSPDIGQGVHGLGTKTMEEIGAGDQGHMFGYATDETEELMPLTHVLATRIGYKLTQVRSLSYWSSGHPQACQPDGALPGNARTHAQWCLPPCIHATTLRPGNSACRH